MEDLQGRMIGPYQILEELGRGGMAVVYKAWQASLHRHVALKVLPPYFRHDAQFLARFHREAVAAAGLSHPNIIQIHDFGEAEGMLYIAMEYLGGGSLHERIAAGPLPFDEAQRVLAQVGGALDYAHAQGLVHRDIKPGNVLFAGDGTAKVADFGIVRAADGTRLTRTGILMGTPEYMAPEQASGANADHRSDLYALGVVLYRMLTGQVPFRGTTPHAIMHAVIYEAPVSPRRLNPNLTPAEESVLLKALAKNPDDRFQSGAALTRALAQARQGVTVPLPGASKQRTELSLSSRQPISLRALTVALVAVLLVAVGGWWLWSRLGAPSPDPAEAALALTAEASASTVRAGIAMTAANRQRETDVVVTQNAQASVQASRTQETAGTVEGSADERNTATAEEVRRRATDLAIAQATADAAEMSAEAKRLADAMATEAAVQATQTALAEPGETPTPTKAPPPTITGPPTVPAAGAVKRRNKDGMDMVYVPAGEFTMGNNDRARDAPAHPVYLDGYWIDRTEVTNAQYRLCVQAGACRAPTTCRWGQPTFDDGARANHPVVCVSWNDAQAYCQWTNAQLPTEAQWEKAARSTDSRAYPWGNAGPDCSRAQYRDCGAHTVAVGGKGAGASPYGALDMAGNVWEWTADWHADDYYSRSPYENPPGPGPGSGKLMRGGSWDAGTDEIQTTFRNAIEPGLMADDVGFRCARR
jgi:formylglycine-generating enzyme required for sulfatase activity